MPYQLHTRCRVILLALIGSLIVSGCSDESPESTDTDAAAPVTEQTPSTQAADPVEAGADSTGTQSMPVPVAGEFSVLKIQEKSIPMGTGVERNVIAVIFSEPVDGSIDFRPHVSLTQLPTNDGNGGQLPARVIEGDWVLTENGREIYFAASQPSTPYRVKVYSGFLAASGRSLAMDVSQDLTTRPVSASVSFESRGSFLPADLSRGLPVTAVNVDKVQVDFHRVLPEQYHEFFRRVQDRYYRYNLYGFDQITELAYSGQFQLDADEHTRKKFVLPVDSIKALNEPGMYVAIMSIAGQLNYEREITYYSVTDVGLHARHYDRRLDVHLASLRSGKPIGGAQVTLLDASGRVVDALKSSPSGLASFTDNGQVGRVVLAQQGESLTALYLQSPALDLSAFELGQRKSRSVEVFLYAPRDLYRPGETATFSALIRDQDGKPVDAVPLSVEVRTATGKVLEEFVWKPRNDNSQDMGGYYEYELTVPETAITGNWQFRVTHVDAGQFNYDFKVEDFLPERMTLEFEAEQSLFMASDVIRVPVNGQYLYGAPAAGNRLESTVVIDHQPHPIPAHEDYEFGDVRQTDLLQRYTMPEVLLDSDGRTILLPAGSGGNSWASTQSPLSIRINSSLFESGGRPVSRSWNGTILPATELIGVRTSFGDKNPTANSVVRFELIKSDRDGKLIAVDDAEISLIREDRQYFWEYTTGEGWHYQYTDSEYPVVTQTVDLTEAVAAQTAMEVEWGYYRLEVTDPVTRLVTSVRFHAGYDWYRNWRETQYGGAAARPDEVKLALDQGAYRAGETARLQVVPPQSGEGIVLVESDQLLWSRKLTLDGNGTTVDIPVSDDWQRHDIYVSVIAFKPGDDRNRITPDRALGVIHLPIDREDRRLSVSWPELAEQIRPESTLNARVRLSDVSGKPIEGKAWLTLAAVDVGVLNITDFQTPDPHDGFFGQRRFGVDARDMYSRLIELNDFDTASLRFGGDADLSRGGQKPATEVQIVSLFQGAVAVDDAGEASIDLSVPYFEGRLKLMAVAWSENAFGHGEAEVTVVSPMVTQLSMPRFLAAGDVTTLALDVHNKSGREQQISIDLDSDPLLVIENGQQQLTLQDDEKQTLYLKATAADGFGGAGIRAEIRGDHLDDISRSWTLGIRPAYPASTFQEIVVLGEDERRQWFDEFADSYASTRHGYLSVSTDAGLNLASHFEYLLGYPYGCLEQTSSRMFPLLYADQDTQRHFKMRRVDDAERSKRIQVGLARLADLQNQQGGYSLWGNAYYEEHWLTVYVTDILVTARNQGYAVPDALFTRSVERLKNYVNATSIYGTVRYSASPDHYQFAYRAYAAYVLSKMNQVNLASMRLLKNKASHSRSALPLVQLALAMKTMGDEKSSDELMAKAFDIDRGEDYLGDYGSSVRDIAMMIHLLKSHDAETARIKKLMLDLVSAMQRRRYLSTQDHIALFLAGLSTRALSNQGYRASLDIAGQTFEVDQQDSYRLSLDADDLASALAVSLESPEPVFVNLAVNGYPVSPPEPVSEALAISRQYYRIDGNNLVPMDALTSVSTGEMVLVHLRVDAEQRTPDALVADLIPAGFELENQNLENTTKLAEFRIDERPLAELMQHSNIQYQEYRDDRYVAAIDANRYQPSHLVYLMRAVTPGTYQVPSAFVEDMYQPEHRAIGLKQGRVTVTNR